MNLWMPGEAIGTLGGHVHTAVFKMEKQQRPTVDTRSSAQCWVQPGWDGTLGENGHMYMCD